jgi:hypothetical protein
MFLTTGASRWALNPAPSLLLRMQGGGILSSRIQRKGREAENLPPSVLLIRGLLPTLPVTRADSIEW